MNFIHSARIFLAGSRGEMKLALAGAPALAWRLLVIAAWAFFAILMGSVVGFAAVALPPMGLAGIIAVFVLILLWVLPEGPTPSEKLIRRLMYAMVAVDLAIPAYYTYQIPGLPWISVRRLVTFAVIILFAIADSSSVESRRVIARVVSYNRPIFFCAAGYLMMVYISIITSIYPTGSASAASGVVLEWYVPFIAAVYAIRSEEQVTTLIKLVLSCALVVSAMGVIDYIFVQHTYLLALPKSMVNSMLMNNPRFDAIVGLDFRNGSFRAPSLFNNALSFAEFEAIVGPIAIVFFLHGRSLFERGFGAVCVVACAAGVFVSGSRGGYLSLLVSAGVLAPLFIVRNRAIRPRGMAAPIFSVFGAAGFSLIAFAVLFVGRVRFVIFASGMGANSTEGRQTQWMMGWPKILANPITGHGYEMGGEVVGYTPVPGAPMTIDSFALSLITETGVPGLILYFGMFLMAVYVGARQYISDRTFAGAIAGGLASSLAGYSTYRLFLSQRENQTLVYIMVACVALLNYFYVRAHETQLEPSAEAPARRARAGGSIAAAT
jgi:O-antigen ligase